MGKPKNICIVSGVFPARSETFVVQHALGLAERRWSVTAVAKHSGKGMNQSEIESLSHAGIRSAYAGGFSSSRVKKLFQMVSQCIQHPREISYLRGNQYFSRPEMLCAAAQIRFIEQINPDIIHIHFGTVAGQFQAAGWSKPTIVTWHGYDANVSPKVRSDYMYQRLFEQNWWHTVGSDFMRQRLLDLGCPEERIVKIPMGVDLSRFSFVNRSKQRDQPLKIVSVGRLSEIKGHSTLIRAIASLRDTGIKTSLRIIGDGPLRQELEELIARNTLGAMVELMGPQPQNIVARELSSGDIFALTGVVGKDGAVETQGVAFIEAQGMGLPVIACDVGGVSESLMDGSTGRLLKSGDIDGIAHSISEYATNPDLRLRHGACGRRFVTQKFSIERMLNEFERLYSEIAPSSI